MTNESQVTYGYLLVVHLLVAVLGTALLISVPGWYIESWMLLINAGQYLAVLVGVREIRVFAKSLTLVDTD